MPELVKRLDLKSAMDHIMTAEFLTNDELKEYEEKEIMMQQKQLNRWFLRNIVLKGNNEVRHNYMVNYLISNLRSSVVISEANDGYILYTRGSTGPS